MKASFSAAALFPKSKEPASAERRVPERSREKSLGSAALRKQRFSLAFQTDERKNRHERQLRTEVRVSRVIPFRQAVVVSFGSASADRGCGNA